jgi:hypothetical protein
VPSVIRDLLTNLGNGARLCRFRGLAADNFRISADQLVLLLVVEAALGFAVDYLDSLPVPQFNARALTAQGFSVASLLLGGYLVTRLVLQRLAMLAIPVLILSAAPALLIAWELLYRLILVRLEEGVFYNLVYGAYVLWWFAVTAWCIRTAAGRTKRGVASAFAVLCAIWVVPVWYLAYYEAFWYPGEEQGGEDPYAAYRQLNVERLFYRQPELLDAALGELAAGRPGVIDIYFLGVGAWAMQDVFLKETLYATRLFEERFDARGRSLALINHLSTRNQRPLASASNLERALRHIGALMDPREDLLVLYMTSHGSRDHKFSVDFWPMPLNDITPQMLGDYLDEAGIKWRVVMISACYSGGFLDTLRSPYTALATASAPERMSFGCNNENDFTYFGKALLKDQLQETYSMADAFAGAAAAIRKREQNEGLEPSDPQLFIGTEIARLLESLARELPKRIVAAQFSPGS